MRTGLWMLIMFLCRGVIRAYPSVDKDDFGPLAIIMFIALVLCIWQDVKEIGRG